MWTGDRHDMSEISYGCTFFHRCLKLMPWTGHRHNMSEIEAIPETEEPTEMTEISMTSKIYRVNRTDNDVALTGSLDISRRSTCVDGDILEQGAGDVILTSVVTQKNGDVRNDGDDVAMTDVTDENENEQKDGEVSVHGRVVLY